MSNQKAEHRTGQRTYVPAQDTEADILAEAGAERDEESGELVADADRVRELGAADPETLREKRRLKQVADKKTKGEKKVAFGTNDPLVVYETILQTWPATSVNITVKRLSGAPWTDVILSHPKSRVDLYAAIKALIGQYAECEYEIRFHDTGGQWLGTGRIVMPSTLGQALQGQPAHPAPPVAQGLPPPAFDPNSTISMVGQMFDMFQRMQSPQRAAPVPPQMPPMPPPNDPAAQVAWMQQLFDMFQRMQPSAPVQPRPPPQAPPQSSFAESFAMFQQMFEMVQRLQPQQPQQPQQQRPAYFPNQQRRPGERPYFSQQQQPPQRPQSFADQAQELMSTLRTAAAFRDELDNFIPGGSRRNNDFEDPPERDNDGPVRIDKIGDIDVVRDNDERGTIRFLETAGANVPRAFKWIGEQINKEQQRRERAERPQRRLSPGYVEVGPGYRPPPGYIAVPEEPDEEEEELPPPPENIPPPIRSTPWDADE